MLADAAAAGRGIKPVPITESEAEATHKLVGSSFAGWLNALPEFQALEAKEGKIFEFK